ncbi:HlyD family type I secretion periplasmic adaptor subunit [Mesorhizobium sp.]|uniref:HlyD family type I secretion periplasmic adaptor subunit n=1 Tax=Mesorhizobium sp. TaxID=1871066 RepID=UPI0025C3FAEA|nr:HlyD family type I secretion periplasmic adaptor subunit [Mesorhizobium sp.]
MDSVANPVSPTIRLTAWTLIALFATIVVGSYVAKTEIVARGEGKVIPASRVQVVQPQVDGKIVKILVAEGQFVTAGDLLVMMDTTAIESEIGRIEASMEEQLQEATVARSIIEPLASGDPSDKNFVEMGKEVLQRQQVRTQAQIAGTEALVVSILSALRDQVAEADAQLNRIARGRNTQRARLDKANSDREIVTQRFASTQTLRKQGTISEFDYLERLRELKAIEGEVVIAERELDGLAAEAEALTNQRASIISTALSTYRKQLNGSEIALQGLQAELRAAKTRLADLSLAAPMDGRVEHLSVFTVGGFVEAGSTLMSIVPSDKTIEIEAFFDNRDVGFLESGQKAFVKFDAFPAERFGIVHGRVTSVGADARGDVAVGKWVYAVRLKLDQPGIQMPEREIRFAPGMTATIDVITGERRLISYFFEPILKAIQDSFGER